MNEGMSHNGNTFDFSFVTNRFIDEKNNSVCMLRIRAYFYVEGNGISYEDYMRDRYTTSDALSDGSADY